MDNNELYIGIMSGTSLDGVDLALAHFENGQTHCIATFEYPLPEQLKQQTLDICQGQPTTLQQIGSLNQQFAYLYADAINQFLASQNLTPSDITAVGCHGQTVFHEPNGKFPFTTQIGDGNTIAVRTGITTVADFRSKDIALGGQGAPLVPAYHQTLFPFNDATKIVLNIGGIANISVLSRDGEVLGYDTGPGNILMDAWINKHLAKPFDHDGRFAQSGLVNKELLTLLLSDSYLKLPPPKSTGREHYNLEWLNQQLGLLNSDLLPQDVQATLLEFTAITIAEQCLVHQQSSNNQLLVCGGGANNCVLMKCLKNLLPHWQLTTTDEHGISGDYMEALAFAWLAHRRIHNLPSNLPKVTGASRATSLGVVYNAD